MTISGVEKQIPSNSAIECPVCGSTALDELYSIDAVEATGHFLTQSRDPSRFESLRQHICTLWGQETCEIQQCRNCGFGFSQPYVAGDARFYGLAYERRSGDYPADKWEYRLALDKVVERIKTLGRDEIRLLEIGAGDGAFLRQVTPKLIPPKQVMCTEYSDYGAAQIRKLEVRVAQCDVRELDSPNHGQFDVVCIFQVLEHMDRLAELFESIRSLTRPAALLLIGVPNPKRNHFNESRGGLLDMPPNHIGRWTESAFKAMASRHGWEIQDFALEPTNRLQSWQQFSIDRHKRAAQQGIGLSAKVARLPRNVLSQGLGAAMVATQAIRSVPVLPKLLAQDMGDAAFVSMTRQG
jgi:SAM-dependent methyltransferase